MKLTLNPIHLLLILTFVVGCKKVEEGTAPSSTDPATPVANSSIVVSSKTATAFTLTWPAATDDATSAADLQYKVVYSTSDNLTDAASAETNGTLVLDWTANSLTTNITSLVNSTTYYIALLVKDVDGNIGFTTTNTATLCTGKRIFLATATSGNLGGKVGADSTCNTQKPVGMGTVKAMLSDNTGINTSTGLPANLNGRQACYGNCSSSALYTLDWVFTANQRYCTSDLTKKVGDSGVTYPVLNVSEANVLSTTPQVIYSGFNIQFANSTTNCSNWSTTSGSFVGGTTEGIFNGSTSSFITGAPAFPDCSSAGVIVCVEQ